MQLDMKCVLARVECMHASNDEEHGDNGSDFNGDVDNKCDGDVMVMVMVIVIVVPWIASNARCERVARRGRCTCRKCAIPPLCILFG
jgi:hypothetical protein